MTADLLASDDICTLFVEDFIGIVTAPSALLDEKWKCRKCNRIAADHSRRQQIHPPQSTTPQLVRHKSQPRIIPPSTGKEPKHESSPKGSPSSEEGIEEGLSFVATSPSMRVSSNSLSIEFVENLQRITTLEEVDKRFSMAAAYVFKNWHHERHTVGKRGVYKNERWLTGIVCNALNLALQAGGGLVALHQGCIGGGSTHSDISVSAIGSEQSPPLLVCEGKQDSENAIRENVKGQLFNELVRHRRIFSRGSSQQTDFRPVLLMAMNTAYVSVDIAFPTTKDGHLKRNDWIYPPESDVAGGDVLFFTIQIAFINIDNEEDGPEKLARLFCFLDSALQKLRDLKEYARDQWKTPWRWTDGNATRSVASARKQGDNVTIVDERRVYKEFCYYLRQKDGFNTIPVVVKSRDQRRVPPKDILKLLGNPYSDWVCRTYAGGWFEVLEYDLIRGEEYPSTKAAWISLLMRISTLHKHGHVHGDLLPRNLIFSGSEGYMIDFDLMRKEGEPYVLGYNHSDFIKYRHPDAKAREEMKKTHDVHALAMIGIEYFGTDENDLASYYAATSITSIEELVKFFESYALEPSHAVTAADSLDASGSPYRD